MKCIFANLDCSDTIKYRMPLAASENSAAMCEYHWTLRKDDVRLAAESECTCWEGYERVPGTKPCASGSCRKKQGKSTLSRDLDIDRVHRFMRKQLRIIKDKNLIDEEGTCGTCDRWSLPIEAKTDEEIHDAVREHYIEDHSDVWDREVADPDAGKEYQRSKTQWNINPFFGSNFKDKTENE